MSDTENGAGYRRQACEQGKENENEADDAVAVITVLTALAGSADTAARPVTASLWSVPAHRLLAAALAPGPSAWWASGLPR